MKSRFLLLGVISILLCCADIEEPSYPEEVEFYLVGTSGLAFTGTVSNRSSSSSISGTTPQSFYVNLENDYDIARGTFHKSAESGTLTVEVYVGSDYKRQASTWASYGSVSISYP